MILILLLVLFRLLVLLDMLMFPDLQELTKIGIDSHNIVGRIGDNKRSRWMSHTTSVCLLVVVRLEWQTSQLEWLSN